MMDLCLEFEFGIGFTSVLTIMRCSFDAIWMWAELEITEWKLITIQFWWWCNNAMCGRTAVPLKNNYYRLISCQICRILISAIFFKFLIEINIGIGLTIKLYSGIFFGPLFQSLMKVVTYWITLQRFKSPSCKVIIYKP